MVSVGYAGPATAPEYAVLAGRKDARIAAICSPDAPISGDDDAPRIAGSPEELIATAGIDAVVLALPPDAQGKALRLAADRRLPCYVAVPVAASLDGAEDALRASEASGAVVSVGRTLRYAINLIQLRRMALERRVRWIVARTVAPNIAPGISGDAIDLVRYVGGEIVGVRSADAGHGARVATLELASGATAIVELLVGTGDTGRTSIEALADEDRMAWYSGTNHIVYNDREYRVAERNKMDDLPVTAIAAFLTAVRTGWSTPILAGLREEVAAMGIVREVERAWGIAPAEGA